MYHKILFSILILYTSFSFAQREVWEDSIILLTDSKKNDPRAHVIGEKKTFTGYVLKYDENNFKKKVSYKNGLLIGPWSTYYSNGQIREEGVNELYGDSHGKYKKYYQNGHLQIEGNYKHNKKDGAWFYFDENGKIVEGGHYFNDEKQGIWQFWNKNGIMYYEEIFQNGELKSMIFYNNEDDAPSVPNIDK